MNKTTFLLCFATAIQTCLAFNCELISEWRQNNNEFLEKFSLSRDFLGRGSFGEVRAIRDGKGNELAAKKQSIRFSGNFELFSSMLRLMEGSHKGNEIDASLQFHLSQSQEYPCLHFYAGFDPKSEVINKNYADNLRLKKAIHMNPKIMETNCLSIRLIIKIDQEIKFIREANQLSLDQGLWNKVTPDFRHCLYTYTDEPDRLGILPTLRIDIFIFMERAQYTVQTIKSDETLTQDGWYYPILKNMPLVNRFIFYIDFAQAIDTVHSQGKVHNDIKPGNLVVDKEGRPQLIDFGGSEYEDVPRLGTGTLIYADRIKFEYILRKISEPSSPAADIYAFAVSLFEMEASRLGDRTTLFTALSDKQKEIISLANKIRCEENPQSITSSQINSVAELKTRFDHAIAEYFHMKNDLVLGSNWELQSHFASLFYPRSFLVDQSEDWSEINKDQPPSSSIDKSTVDDLLSKTYSCQEFIDKIGKSGQKELLNLKLSPLVSFHSFMENIMTNRRTANTNNYSGKLARHLRRFLYHFCLRDSAVMRI